MSVVHIHFLYVRTFSHRIGSNTIFLSFFVCCYLLCLFIYLIYIFISHRTMHTTHRSTYNLHIEFHPFFSTYSELSTNSQQNWFHFAQTSTETRYIKPLLIYCLLIRLHSESFKVYFKHTHFLLWMHGRIDFTVVAVFYTCPKINQCYSTKTVSTRCFLFTIFSCRYLKKTMTEKWLNVHFNFSIENFQEITLSQTKKQEQI